MRYEPDFGRGWIKREFGRELRDFYRYIRRPGLAPRRRRPDDYPPWLADWLPVCPWRLLLTWLAFLWGINLLILGPIILFAAEASGAQHKLSDISGLTGAFLLFAIVGAPVAEEMIFRYGLRRPTHVFWMAPLIVVPAIISGVWLDRQWPGVALGLILAVITSASLVCTGRLGSWGWRWRRVYVRRFGWVFHFFALAFAGAHLLNYQLGGALWVAPLLVCSQWLSGMVLGWMRVTRSLGTSIVLHGCFNGGPLLLFWGAKQMFSGLDA